MQLSVDENISASAHKKLARAEKLFIELRDDVLGWVESGPLRFHRIRQDSGKQQQIVAEVLDKPEYGHWEALYGDLLSNVQAARDALFHDILKLPGVTAPKTRHYFPASRTEEQWSRVVERYSSIPESLIDRMKRIQPFTDRQDDGFTSKEYVDTSAAHAFREANNHSKHRGVLPIGVLFEVHTWNSPNFPVTAEAIGLEELDWIVINESSPKINILSTVKHKNPEVLESLSFEVYASVGIFRAERAESEAQVWDQLLRNAAIAYTQAVADVEITCIGEDDPERSAIAADYLDFAYNFIAEIPGSQ